MQHYYEVNRTSGGWVGKVYHYDSTGNREIIDHKTEPAGTEHEASQLLETWMDAHPEIDATLA